MRRIIFLLTFLYSICSFTQVKDNFSDGDFSENPTWSGDIEKFKVDKKGQLKLNDLSKTGDAYLSTASELISETTWMFYVHLLFNSSANNDAIFYLTSSTSDLSGEGYMLMIGGQNDNLRLLKYDGNIAEVLIDGIIGHLDTSSPEINIKIHCDKDGKWIVCSQLIGVDEDYIEEGTAIDNTITKSAFAGIRCIYSASRNMAFAFDDVFIFSDNSVPDIPDEPDNPDAPDEPDIPNPDDILPPKLLSVAALTDSTVIVSFDEVVNIGSSEFEIEEIGKSKKKQLSKDKRSVELLFTGKFTDSVFYTLYINKVKDISGNYMTDSQIGFTYYNTTLQTASFGDIVFNEIMANPLNVAALPEVEYVELYNKMERPVNLNEWKFHYGNKSYKLGNKIIPPKGYLVLCHEKKLNLWKDEDVLVLGVKSFPELANSGKLLWLEDARSKIISWVEYSGTWYKDSFKKKGGFSLECLDTDNLANGSENWVASTDKSGGTPGRVNSVAMACPDETVAEVDYYYLLTPDTLVIRFSKSMDIASLMLNDNYTIYQGNSMIANTIPSVPDSKQVVLSLSDSLRMGDVFELELTHLKDISGFDLEGECIIRVGVPEDAKEGEVLFNEILFNPRSGGSDYVELYNSSGKYINLNRLFFASRLIDGNMGERVLLSPLPRTLAPHSYLCFTKDVKAVESQYELEKTAMVSLSKLPSLPDDKGNIVLLATTGEIVDELNYTEKMHTAFLSDKEGIALEKIYPDKLSAITKNWLSASTASGGGTPGYVNSQYREATEASSDGFRLEHQAFSPDGDGVDDELIISYNFLDTDVLANISVYDSSGRFICKIAEGDRLEQQGIFVWNGQESNGSVARIGLYIIYIEAYTPSGKMNRYKLACALVG